MLKETSIRGLEFRVERNGVIVWISVFISTA